MRAGGTDDGWRFFLALSFPLRLTIDCRVDLRKRPFWSEKNCLWFRQVERAIGETARSALGAITSSTLCAGNLFILLFFVSRATTHVMPVFSGRANVLALLQEKSTRMPP